MLLGILITIIITILLILILDRMSLIRDIRHLSDNWYWFFVCTLIIILILLTILLNIDVRKDVYL